METSVLSPRAQMRQQQETASARKSSGKSQQDPAKASDQQQGRLYFVK